ncbi:MAG: single-stranded DNA-binding protein [Acidimicrobiales bacterium]
MAFDNTVTLIGNITRDPELRFTPNGAAVATFGLAWNRRYQRNGEQVEEVSFFDITCWSSLAENVCESLVKGNRVVVYGRLEQRSWENSEGERRSKVEVIADEVAPSLRWASAEVNRNERSESAQGGGSGGSGNRGGGGGSNRSVSNEPGGGSNYDFDEEPF